MIPKDIKGKELVKRLKLLGYVAIRQNGSHIRVQTEQNGKHSETVPNHDPMKQGTLRKILKNIATHFDMTLDEIESILFAKYNFHFRLASIIFCFFSRLARAFNFFSISTA